MNDETSHELTIPKDAFHWLFATITVVHLLDTEIHLYIFIWLPNSGDWSRFTRAHQVSQSIFFIIIARILHICITMHHRSIDGHYTRVYESIKWNQCGINDHHRIGREFGVCSRSYNDFIIGVHLVFPHNSENCAIFLWMVSNVIAVSPSITECNENAAILL